MSEKKFPISDQEMSVLSAVCRAELMKPGSARRYFRILDESHFDSPLAQSVFIAARKINDAGYEIDGITVPEQFESDGIYTKFGVDGEFVKELFSIHAGLDNVQAYLDARIAHQRKTTSIEKVSRLREAVLKDDPEALWTLLREIRETSIRNRKLTAEEQVYSILEEKQSGKADRSIITGYSDLDQKMHGYAPRCLYTYYANPGHGKTVMAINTAIKISRMGKKVLYATAEMSPRDIYTRIIAAKADVSAFLFHHGKCGQEDWAKIGAVHDLADERLAVEYTRTLTEIYQSLIYHRPDVLIIDHIHALTLPKADSRETATALLIQGINDMTVVEDIPTIMMAQTRKEADRSKPPSIDSIYYSKEIEFWSFMCASLFWPMVASADGVATPQISDFEIDIKKMRLGLRGKIVLSINKDSLALNDIDVVVW